VDSGAAAGAGAFATVLYLAILVVAIVAMWRIFVKAGEPGWASIVPIYNAYTLVKIAGMDPLLFLFLLIPFVGQVFLIYVLIKVGEAFGKSVLWSVVFVVLLSLIGWLMLGFGSETYHKPASAGL
jgi:hypothetical protein